MSQEILTNLQSEIQQRQKKIDDAQTSLDAARADYKAFVEQIATSLKITKPTGQSKETVKRRQAKVLELYEKGTPRVDMASLLRVQYKTVDNDLRALKLAGKIVPLKTQETPPVSPPVNETEGDDDESPDKAVDKPASKDQLLNEVARQQRGERNKIANLKTTLVHRHTHVVKVDRMGDGQTVTDSSGHVHRCFRFFLSEAQKHTHELVV